LRVAPGGMQGAWGALQEKGVKLNPKDAYAWRKGRTNAGKDPQRRGRGTQTEEGFRACHGNEGETDVFTVHIPKAGDGAVVEGGGGRNL